MFDFSKKNTLPELLCPAGSPEALDAAIEGGADAVYLGGSLFNARMNAQNFNSDALRAAVLRAHTYGVKVYQTLNTLCTDREHDDFLQTAKDAYLAGVDALIVADLGGASLIHSVIPDFELHASTQMSGHCADMGHELSKLGFSRMVIARESSAENIRTVVQNSPIEVEIFIHGALCVSHSGQCLFSSLVGGRSGNRGTCAQPCRLPYSCPSCKKSDRNEYPLSLKDLSLAMHIPSLIESGVSSLKIEGRMKSPEYVYETARIWRTLLDERRSATEEELQRLAGTFSRGGFTDGYYTKRIDRRMLGIRSDNDKERSRAIEPFGGLTRRIALTAQASILRSSPTKMTLSDGIHTVTVLGEAPMDARNAPLSQDTVKRNLSKTGGTPYEIQAFDLTLDDGLMLPISRLNELRRRAVAALDEARTTSCERTASFEKPIRRTAQKPRTAQRTARFASPSQITERAKQYFARIDLPLHQYTPDATGVILPPVLFDSDRECAITLLQKAAREGASSVSIGNLGHLALARTCDLPLIGDFRLNVTNSQTAATLEALGLDELLLSPELTLPQIRDIRGNTAVIVYGRIPLMTLEKCVIREIADCRLCQSGTVRITDRRGVEFPVLREWEHRNVIYNSIPTCMSDRREELARYGIQNCHFIFSDETPEEVDEVIDAFENGIPLPKKVRRLSKS